MQYILPRGGLAFGSKLILWSMYRCGSKALASVFEKSGRKSWYSAGIRFDEGAVSVGFSSGTHMRTQMRFSRFCVMTLMAARNIMAILYSEVLVGLDMMSFGLTGR